MLEKLKKQRGFTLIEIVLVLAIAALILLLVFLALSGAQKARRDTTRKEAAAQMLSEVENYAADNGGTYWADQATFNTNMKSGGAYALTGAADTDPLSGSAYTTNGLVTPTSAHAAGVSYTITNNVPQVCIGLEQGTSYCVSDNQ